MERGILESDWKLFRKLRVVALDRFCARALAELGAIAADASRSNHERYLAIYKLIEQRDERLADAFNGARRSVAALQLAQIMADGLLTADEFAEFSSETRGSVQNLLEIRRM